MIEGGKTSSSNHSNAATCFAVDTIICNYRAKFKRVKALWLCRKVAHLFPIERCPE